MKKPDAFDRNGAPSNTADGIMVKLFRKIAREDGHQYRYDSLLNNYVNSVAETSTARKKIKNNLMIHMFNTKMSFKQFIILLQNVFKVCKIEFVVTLHYDNGKVSSHDETFILNTKKESEDE